MPFSTTETATEEQWDKTYQKFFKPLIQSLGFTCTRSEVRNKPFTDDIIRNLKNSDLLIADITDYNPNVMWELGVRHALSQRTIMIARDEMKGKIPSDLQHYGVLFYKRDVTDYDDFKEQISKVLKDMESDPDGHSGPVFSTLKMEELIIMSFERKQIVNKMIGLITELGENLEFANNLVSGKEIITDAGITSIRYHSIAIEHLITTNYVYAGISFIKVFQTIRQIFYGSNYQLDLSTSTPDKVHRNKLRDSILVDAKTLQTSLPVIIKATQELLRLIKTNSLKQEEPEIVLSDDIKKKLFP